MVLLRLVYLHLTHHTRRPRCGIWGFGLVMFERGIFLPRATLRRPCPILYAHPDYSVVFKIACFTFLASSIWWFPFRCVRLDVL